MHKTNKTYQLNGEIVWAYNRNRKFLKRQLSCYAPSRSMRFSLTGNVLACCFNRYYNLGKYPDNNIHDIWFGNKKNEICVSIKNNDFSKGCQVCYNSILSENFHAAGSIQYDYLPKIKHGYPTMLDFEIGNTCNLECIMCNGENSSLIRQKREGKKPHLIPYDHTFANQLEEFIPFLSEARFVGGEPFITDLHFTVWEKLIRINPSVNISVLTNATVLNDRIKQIINAGNFSISVSIDSFTKKTYEAIRINADFDKVWTNILYFQDYAIQKKRPFFINICPIKQNRFEIPEMIEYCNNHQITIIFHTVIFPVHSALWNLTLSEIEETILVYKKYNPSRKNSLQNKNTTSFLSLIQQLEQWKEKAEIREKQPLKGNSKDLKEELFENLNIYLVNLYSDSSKIKLIKEQINTIIQNINNETITNKALFIINQIEPARIIAEFEISNEMMLYERFLSLGQ